MAKPATADERPPGALPLLEGKAARDWGDPRVSHDLRSALVFTDLMFREASGGRRSRVTQILGAEAPYSHGVAADVSLEGLPGVQSLDPQEKPPPIAVRICEVLNANTPRPDGLPTFTANGSRIMVNVPIGGPPRYAGWWADWPTLGATGLLRHSQAKVSSLEGRMTVARKRVYFPRVR